MSTHKNFTAYLIDLFAPILRKFLRKPLKFVKYFAIRLVADKTIAFTFAITLLKKLYNFVIYVKIMATKDFWSENLNWKYYGK